MEAFFVHYCTSMRALYDIYHMLWLLEPCSLHRTIFFSIHALVLKINTVC